MTDYKKEIYNLKEKCYLCKDCSLGQCLVEGLDPHVFSNGKVPSDFVFVAEAPGKSEVEQKLPLVGRSGKLYNNDVLGALNFDRKDVYTTNTCHCRPEGNRKPLPIEMESCKKFLDAEICLNDPKLIITFGSVALYGICGTIGISKKRGKINKSIIWSNNKYYPVFPMFHPAFILRGSGVEEWRKDIKILKIIKDSINNFNFDYDKRLDECKVCFGNGCEICNKGIIYVVD